ncbi:hypothetical protein AK88_00291 [Plasmodium fragile]|uniref:Methyltransferase small domain-containing protein n=1 Tax=Plasmodium fragile TaxID=5857 RepID=A0A0D9QTG3_PLAFR|nr:uncharacterized protein AK88_00291 [Plasmodium fragile]KJP90122.1 hypothetical protein AK88_00291 [Plasmodium fragile]
MASPPEVKINFDHIYTNEGVRKHVYLPSSDTFTCLEALEEDVENIPPTVQVALEMGTGSGYLILSLHELLLKKKQKLDLLYCLDINEKACKCVRKLTLDNKISNVEIINTDLFSNLRQCKQFDLVLFNPPYVPTEQDEMNKTDIVASYAGGQYGREIILKFLLSVYDYVSDKGVIYLLMEKNNRPNEILKDDNISSRFNYTELKRKRTLNESIFIYKLSKKGS